jgi:hypothetical protein
VASFRAEVATEREYHFMFVHSLFEGTISNATSLVAIYFCFLRVIDHFHFSLLTQIQSLFQIQIIVIIWLPACLVVRSLRRGDGASSFQAMSMDGDGWRCALSDGVW